MSHAVIAEDSQDWMNIYDMMENMMHGTGVSSYAVIVFDDPTDKTQPLKVVKEPLKKQSKRRPGYGFLTTSKRGLWTGKKAVRKIVKRARINTAKWQ